MKTPTRFFLSVSGALLLSSVLLAVCMGLVARGGWDTPRPYTQDRAPDPEQAGQEEGEAALSPDSLSLMEAKGKFSVYLHPEGRKIQIFSEEQEKALRQVREKGERRSLSYAEILFLIADSVDLYFGYDEIKLPGAGEREILTPYHGDFSEYRNPADRKAVYDGMLADIAALIRYRLSLHDAGFVKITENALTPTGKGLQIEDEVFLASEDALYRVEKPWGVVLGEIYLLSLREGKDSGETYRKDLAREYLKKKQNESLKSPLLFASASTFEIWVEGKDGTARERLFPTAELAAMAPES